MNVVFSNRAAAGRLLAEKLLSYAGTPGLIVLAIPHGGVPVGAEVARVLHAPLDVLEVGKLGAPSGAVAVARVELGLSAPPREISVMAGQGQAARRNMHPARKVEFRRDFSRTANAGLMELLSPGFGFGAVASGDLRVLNSATSNALGVRPEAIERATRRELKNLHRREQEHRHGRTALVLRDRPVIIVDDVVATGSTLRVAIAAVREARAGLIVVATPVASRASFMELRERVHDFVTLSLPREFGRIGFYYTDFEPVTDAEVRRLLDLAWAENLAVTAEPDISLA